jgi:Fe-S-cluster-containing dehydrogenase component
MKKARYGIDDNPIFVIDQSRCIGCEACVQACEECGTHRGQSLIHLERIDRAASTQTAPMVCMHCEDPTCANVCPADAIKQTEGGVVQSALKPRCIGCSNCVLACPFGVPKYVAEFDQMMKCDMCTDRTSEGYAPMCASVCPSEALWYGTTRGVPRHPQRVAARQLAVRPPGRAHQGLHRRRRPRRRTARRAGRTHQHVARRPVRPRGGTMTDSEPVPVADPTWKRDFPYEAPPRKT